jgi:hypothetical protein
MKTKLVLLFVFLSTRSIELYAQQPQGSSNANQIAIPNHQVSPYQDNLVKLPFVIMKSTALDTLTIRFDYGNENEIRQIESKNKAGITETISFRYVKSKIIYTQETIDDETKIDTLYTNDGLITEDPNYSYIYSNRKLVKIKSRYSFGDHYNIRYDEAGNAIEMIRIIPPLMKGDEKVTQLFTFDYDETLKARFFFTTDWYFCPIYSFSDDGYELPSASLFGLGSNNLVKESGNGRIDASFFYEYLSFDESGYPTHYTISQSSDYKPGKQVVADYKISYIIPVNIVNGKWGCVDKNSSQIIPYKFDTATYKDFSFNGKVISCTKSGIRICMDTVGNMLSLKTNAGKSYNTICDAITSGDVIAIKNFIDFGVNLNAQYKYRYKDFWNDNIRDGYPGELLLTSVNLDIKKAIAELFGLFIAHGFNINDKTSFYSMIVQVIRSEFSKDDKIKMLQMLIDNHANVNEIGKNSNTALMELCDNQRVFGISSCTDVYDIAKFLIENGADPAIKNPQGNTAEKISKKTNCNELIDLLIQNKKKK